MDIKELARYIVKSLVDNPDDVLVTEIKGSRVTILELKVAKSDIGKVIGKKGRNVQAIRTILKAVSAKIGMPVTLELIE